MRGAFAWSWTVGVLICWSIISAYRPGDLTAFGVPACLSLLMGTLIFTRVRGNPIGLVMMVGGSAWLVYTGFGQYAIASVATGPYPAEYVSAWLGVWTGPIFYVSFAALLLLFPDGEARGLRRWGLWGLALVPLAAVAGGAQLWGTPIEVLIDQNVIASLPEYRIVDAAFLVGLFSIVPATVSIVMRFRSSRGVARQQIKWFATGAVALAVGLVLGAVTDEDGSSIWWDFSILVGMSLFPLSIAIAIFRYRLYELGRVVSRTVSYAIVVGLLGGGVAAMATLIGVQFENPLVVAATTLGAAAAFSPLLRRVQRWVDRRFNRSRYDAQRIMDEFAGSLRAGVDSEAVVGGWLGVVSEAMQPSSVGIWVRQ